MSKIFISHGHNENVRMKLKQFLQERLSLEPIVLQDEPDLGMTIVEKLERYGSNCSFALIVLTSDDVTIEGGKRARQNVIHELGFFHGKLGRDRVLLLKQQGVELFTNISGVIYKEFNGNDIEKIFDDIRAAIERGAVSPLPSIPTTTSVFNQQQRIITELLNYIEKEKNNVRKATLIQYSGQMVKDVLESLLLHGADVTLFLQSKETASKISKVQVNRIGLFSDLMKTELDSVNSVKGSAKLKVYEYDPPASLRAIKLDEKVLAIGWYIYQYVDKENPRDKLNYPEDDIKLYGHNIPGKLLFAGSQEFEIMNKLFQDLITNFSKHIKAHNIKPIYKV